MKKSNKSSKCAKWILRLLVFVGRALLIIADYLDDQTMNGSSLKIFNGLKSMFILPEDKDEESEEQQ